MPVAAIATAILLSTSESVLSPGCNPRWPCTLISIHSDDTYSVGMLDGQGRTTPVIDANIVDGYRQDIDGDGVEELVVIDDRESAFGSATAVYYDLSLGEPYLAFQCPASTAEAAQTECPVLFEGFSAQRAIRGADIIYSVTRVEGELDWETQHLAIPNWTTTIALTIGILNVDLHRARHENADGSPETLADLEAALDLRELRALQFSIAD